MPRRVVNTHEDGDHVWGNQLFEGAEIIAHRTVPDRMRQVADPRRGRSCCTSNEPTANSATNRQRRLGVLRSID
jgi:glyoxylase-like metal-dependent hydrolase (beta-lactamase superfamily II)